MKVLDSEIKCTGTILPLQPWGCCQQPMEGAAGMAAWEKHGKHVYCAGKLTVLPAQHCRRNGRWAIAKPMKPIPGVLPRLPVPEISSILAWPAGVVPGDLVPSVSGVLCGRRPGAPETDGQDPEGGSEGMCGPGPIAAAAG